MSASKFPIHHYETFASIPLPLLDNLKFSVFIIDYGWLYRYVNKYASNRLKGLDIIGRNIGEIWRAYPQFKFQPLHALIDPAVQKREAIEIRSKSPVTNKSIGLQGYPLTDCYFFSVTELQDKESLLTELKNALKRTQ